MSSQQNEQNSEAAIFMIRQRFDDLKKIESLSELEESELTQLRNGIEEEIEEVILSGNSYSKLFCQELAEYFKKSQKLTKVDMHDSFVARLSDEIPEAITFLGSSFIGKCIVELNISDNAINEFGAASLIPFLEQATNLQVFLINNAGLGIEGVKTIVSSLGKGTVNLERLGLARNRMESEGTIALCDELPRLSKIRELNVSQNGIKQEGMVVLMRGLVANCASLHALDVSDNFLNEDEAVRELAILVESVKQLISLNISDCNIQEEDNNVIIRAIESSTNLQQLMYSYSELNDEQAIRLLNVFLNRNVVLTRLEIKGNDLSSETKNLCMKSLREKSQVDVTNCFDSENEEDEDENDDCMDFENCADAEESTTGCLSPTLTINES